MGRLSSRLAAAILLSLGLSACAIPPAISIASMAADGLLLATTGKSKADHGLSLATGQNCATFRMIEGEDVCQAVVVAQPEALPAEVERDLARLRAAPKSAGDGNAQAALASAFSPVPPAQPVFLATTQPVFLAAAPRQAVKHKPAAGPRLALVKAKSKGKAWASVKRAKPARVTMLPQERPVTRLAMVLP